MKYTYKTKGVCSREIHIEEENGIVTHVDFVGGCNGNLQGICKLAEGQKMEDLIAKLQGIRCGFKDTSCPDQLSRALTEMQKA